ncbi:DUF3788 domain-containing protein [Clostridium polynesiense]|uniref:DUF3788 domain-containing protein n=1 Tax=Clostridium polynesiense TaxID=1325933 RepID=UPI00058FEAD6|nr:DUF3788 domain-containing protein [Clostridium polynesiense]
MLEKLPTEYELNELMGKDAYRAWCSINNFIKDNYNMDMIWDNGGKTGVFELKYRKSGKTFCALYPREEGIRILIIFGRNERGKFEASREYFSDDMNYFYDSTHEYHDGKWLYLDITKDTIMKDIEGLLLIKKKPNRRKE